MLLEFDISVLYVSMLVWSLVSGGEGTKIKVEEMNKIVDCSE